MHCASASCSLTAAAKVAVVVNVPAGDAVLEAGCTADYVAWQAQAVAVTLSCATVENGATNTGARG